MSQASKRGARHRAVSIQIRVWINRPVNIKLTRAFLADAVRYRMETGENLPGIIVTGVVWENPNKTYYYEDEPEITRALYAAHHMMRIDPSVFHPVRAD